MVDDQFLIKLKSGERTAFHQLVIQHKDRVLNTCYRFLLNKEDAEDVSQEVFIEVFQSLRHFRGDAQLSTWIYRIAVSKCLDGLKKRKRKKRISSIGKVLHIDNMLDWFSSDSTASTHVEEKESLREISEALDKLPDNQRIAFTLSKIEGYSNREIAEIMKTTIVSVETWIHRAKNKTAEELQRILQKQGR